MANIIHVKKGDQVVVISGKSKGEEGKVEEFVAKADELSGIAVEVSAEAPEA